jgi:hypothetical protein
MVASYPCSPDVEDGNASIYGKGVIKMNDGLKLGWRMRPIALCSDIGPMLLPRPGGGMSRAFRSLRRSMHKSRDIGGVLLFH